MLADDVLGEPLGLAVDEASSELYFTDFGAGKLYRALITADGLGALVVAGRLQVGADRARARRRARGGVTARRAPRRRARRRRARRPRADARAERVAGRRAERRALDARADPRRRAR